MLYLHHQWSDGAHTLQFCSTNEYFETTEYELHRPLGVRDSTWLVTSPKSQGFVMSPNWVQTLSKFKNSRCYQLHTVHMKLCEVGLTPDFFPSTSLDLYIVGKILKTSVLVSKQSKICFTKNSLQAIDLRFATWTSRPKLSPRFHNGSLRTRKQRN